MKGVGVLMVAGLLTIGAVTPPRTGPPEAAAPVQ
jgi:hypothetical protein